MKKRRKRIIILAITLLIVWRLWPATLIFTGLNLRVETDFSRINEAIPPQEEPKVAYQGLSHPFFESGPLWTEIIFKPRKIIHGHGFTPHKEDGAVINAIAAILADRSTFQQWAGEKMCGGFHADYYLKWKIDSDTWEILLCMGCHEAIIFHDGLSLRCDLTSDAAKRIEATIKNGG